MSYEKNDEPESLGQGTVIIDSGKALKVRLEDDRELWIPKSTIHDDSEVFEGAGQSGVVIVKVWWAADKGLA